MSRRGFTIAELVIVVALVGIIASIAMPVASSGVRRQKEIELRDHLRKITEAIDRYHDLRVALGTGTGGVQIADLQMLGAGNYPKELKDVVKGIKLTNDKTMKLLRARDLVDPMTGGTEWDVRSTTDDPGGSGTDGANVFEVHSKSHALALDGKTHYNEW